MREYRVIVIGGGHAGAEAAWAAANLLPEPGSVALVTLRADTIGVMSCNPAIGGLAKGQLVREIDAMGGLMGLAADATGIHFRLLNTSKGPAVQGPRAQCDKHAYAATVRAMLESRREIDIIEARVEEILVERGRVQGVVIAPTSPTPEHQVPTSPKRERGKDAPNARENPSLAPRARQSLGHPDTLRAPTVILTTGTFMRGLMHEGETRRQGGRAGEGAANAISDSLQALGFELGRLKTGTPPRVRKGSIDWESLPIQPGDKHPRPFSDLTEEFTTEGTKKCERGMANTLIPRIPSPDPSPSPNPDSCPLSVPSVLSVVSPSSSPSSSPPRTAIKRFPNLPQLDCRQTHTTPQMHELIRANLHRAPIFSGEIESMGPRYCPSIEDKVVRFADRESHGVFLEPESHESDWIYCNGISTSLPRDIQEPMVKMLPGLERAEIVQHGYAVEYDIVRPHQILATCQTKRIEGLYLAGQINGTSGYEEAAAQGLIAGINAARQSLNQGEVTLGRDQAYIGVLMDDLVTKTPVEPYRMFTSRAEHRILLRADNAPDRLTPIASELGLLETTELGRRRMAIFADRTWEIEQIQRAIDGGRIAGVPLTRALLRPEFGLDELLRALPDVLAQRRSWFSVLADRKYAHYVERQRVEIRRQALMERRRIPELSVESLSVMRTEARDAMMRFTPSTFGQASRLEGITPADLTLLAVVVERVRRAG